MEQKRPPFRFRIPWISETSSRRPKKEPKSPFRPPGIAPTLPPSSSSATNEPSPPSSSASQQGKQKMTASRKSEQKMKSLLKITPESEQDSPPHTFEKKSTHHTGKLGKTHEEAPEEVERKMMFATSNPTGKDIKVVSSKDPMTSKVSSISTQNPVVPNAEKTPLQKGTIDDVTKGIIEDLTNYVHKVSIGKSTKAMDENPFNVITLAGENRGATMNVGSNPKKERSIHIHRAYKKNADQSHEVTTDGEESSEEESIKSMKKDEAGNAYVNSNIQSVNNSLMLQSSTNDRDPGVHMGLPQKPEKPVKCDDKRGLGSRNSEVKVSRNDQVSQGPRIRRRCLRGMLAEPTDSDPDNPNKPIRHGCKYNCGNV